MRIGLSLIFLIPTLAFANEVLTPTVKPPTRQEVESAVARCDDPNQRLRKDSCDVLRNRLKVLNGELPKDHPITNIGNKPSRLPQQ